VTVRFTETSTQLSSCHGFALPQADEEYLNGLGLPWETRVHLHAYRIQPNSDYSQISVDLTDPHLYFEAEGEDCELLKRHVGRGDVEPPLERPALS
jgi:hypothetical protein